MAVQLPEPPPGFTVGWTPGDVTELLAGSGWGQHDGPSTEGYCKPFMQSRPEHCMRVTCERCGAYWDGGAPDFVRASTFQGGHQRLCSKRPMEVVTANLANMLAVIEDEEGYAPADYLIAQELDFAVREYGVYPWTYQMLLSVLQRREEKLRRRFRKDDHASAC